MPKLYMAPVDLRRWRMARQYQNPKWTQEYTARFFGISDRSWRRYECGDREIPQWLVRRVCAMRLTVAQKTFLSSLPTKRAA